MRNISLVVACLATHGVSTKERLSRLEKMDLTMVNRKLMEPYPEGKGWNKAQADEAELWYRRYLATIIVYPDATRHVPNMPIDAFWHQHILDTMAYGKDMQHVVGYFIHHYPYFGLNGDADQRDDSFVETNNLYQTMFGEDCTQMKTFFREQETKGSACHGETCSQGCSNCGRDNRQVESSEVEHGAGCQQVTCRGARSADGEPSNVIALPIRCHDKPPIIPLSFNDFGRGMNKALVASSCNSGGSGTGCGQGCSRGG